MTKGSLTDAQLDRSLRHTLRVVADTVTAAEHTVPAARSSTPSTLSTPGRGRSHRRRRIGLVLGAAALPIAATAAAYLRSGPEYVDQIPPDAIIVRGSVDGSEYLLVETRRTRCGEPVEGVELVEERENLLGSEWNTIGEEYGEPIGECRLDKRRFLADPALFNDGGTRVGDSMVWLWSLHPDVTAVRITTSDGFEDLPVHSVDGAGYALFEVPGDLETYTAELLIDGEVVPGSAEVHRAIPRE